jgi:hypothetical protein
MESRAFIRTAALLTERINIVNIGHMSVEEEREQRSAIQRELNQLFGGMQNPTLPSAYKLRDLALACGYSVDPRVQGKLQQAESFWH